MSYSDDEKREAIERQTSLVSVTGSSDGLSPLDSSKPYIDLTVDLTDAELARRETWWYKASVFLWDSADKHPLERKFLVKLDSFMLSFACLGYFIKTLDQGNIGTAYVNGMEEYYDMKGNDYNLLNTVWTVGYIIGQIPSNLILQRVSARYYLAGLEIIWAVLTVLTITPKSISSMCALRFFVGLLESGYFPGLEYLLGSWYSKEELTKRSAFFACSGTAASLVSGPLQQRILTASWAQHHLEPFQWMFIIDGIISVPIAIFTFIACPNTPSTTKAIYFNDTDKLIALERRRRNGSQLQTREPYTLAKIKSFFNTWHIWVFPPLFLFYNNACQPTTSQAFQLWIKNSLKLDSYYYNNYPSIMYGVAIACTLLAAYTNDYFRGRLTPVFMYLLFFLYMLGCLLLAIWDIPRGLHWACYFFIGIPYAMGQPFIFAWLNNSLQHDDMKRNFVVVITNVSAYVTGAWVPMLTFNQDDAPEFYKGFTYTACLGAGGIVFTTIVLFFMWRDEKGAAKAERVKLDQ